MHLSGSGAILIGRTFFFGGRIPVGIKRDGSVWRLDNMSLHVRGFDPNQAPIRMPMETSLEGTDLTSIVESDIATLGIRSDGTLWANGEIPPKLFGQAANPSQIHRGVRIGTKSDWIALTGDSFSFAALESNGAISSPPLLGNSDQYKHPSKYSDWLAVAKEIHTWALAKDGTLCCWDEYSVTDYIGNIANTEFSLYLGPTRRPVASINILDGAK